MRTKDVTTGAPERAAASPSVALPGRSPGDPLGVLFAHLRDHPRVDAAAFFAVDVHRRRADAHSGWFASPRLRETLAAAFATPEGRDVPLLVEAGLERERPLFLPRVEDWQAASELRDQLHGDDPDVSAAWEAMRQAAVIACPVRTSMGRTLGVLVVLSVDPDRALQRGDLDTVEVLADLAALARERARLLATEAARAREELLLKRASEGTAASLEMGEIEERVVEHALRLVAADHALLTRLRPGGRGLEPVASAGGAVPAEFEEGAVRDAARRRLTVRMPGPDPALHVPIALGARAFGVLSAIRPGGPEMTDREVDLLETLARMSAAAMANAVDFERERRVARALTLGFVPESIREVPGYDVGVLYEPCGDEPSGGDVYGAWALPEGQVGVLVGDVAGKGVESAGMSAMARFFIEARSWDCACPALVLAQAGRMLRARLPEETFVTAFFAVFGPDGMRYANAGHLAPLLCRADGTLEEVAGGGMPLGIESDPSYEGGERALGAGDLVLAFTDGWVEARRGGELFGADRLSSVVAEAAKVEDDAQALVRRVHGEVRGWAGSLRDDVAALGLRRRG